MKARPRKHWASYLGIAQARPLVAYLLIRAFSAVWSAVKESTGAILWFGTPGKDIRASPPIEAFSHVIPHIGERGVARAQLQGQSAR